MARTRTIEIVLPPDGGVMVLFFDGEMDASAAIEQIERAHKKERN